LAPVTLQNYCSRGKSDLVRGEDFIVQLISPYRRRLMITERGLRQLKARAYRVFGDSLAHARAPYAVEAGRCRRLS
jgi:hypothetical protein